LLDVDVRRARGLGRGKDASVLHVGFPFLMVDEVRDGSAIANIFLLDGLAVIPVLPPEMAGVYGVLREVLDRLRAAKASRSRHVNSELLPVELQAALKRLAEATIAIAVNTLRGGYVMAPVGSLLVACNPRVEGVVVPEATSEWDMYVYYVCRSHMGDAELKLEIEKTDKFVAIDIDIYLLRTASAQP
jgi:hypothetical protein